KLLKIMQELGKSKKFHKTLFLNSFNTHAPFILRSDRDYRVTIDLYSYFYARDCTIYYSIIQICVNHKDYGYPKNTEQIN
ncbi:hypothetical protein ABK046_51445, partial [Streptomyces caeruleatus]